MFSLSSSNSYYLYKAPCDMRKSFDSLSGLIRNELGCDPAGGDVFVFVNRRKTCIKLLHWETGGFVLYYKRLEKGTFTPPKSATDSRLLSWPELVLMIEGIQVQKSTRKPRYQIDKQS